MVIMMAVTVVLTSKHIAQSVWAGTPAILTKVCRCSPQIPHSLYGATTASF
jgi:hypothetical protein